MSTARTTRLSRCRRTSVRLLSASGAASVVLASFLLGALDFALVKATTTPRRVEPFGLLEGLPGEAVAQAREWERHLVEVVTGLPPGAPQDAKPRPQYDVAVPLNERDRANAEELTAAGQPVSERTVRRLRARYAEQGLVGLVDQRVMRPTSTVGRADDRLVTAIRAELDVQTHTSTGHPGPANAPGRGTPGGRARARRRPGPGPHHLLRAGQPVGHGPALVRHRDHPPVAGQPPGPGVHAHVRVAARGDHPDRLHPAGRHGRPGRRRARPPGADHGRRRRHPHHRGGGAAPGRHQGHRRVFAAGPDAGPRADAARGGPTRCGCPPRRSRTTGSWPSTPACSWPRRARSCLEPAATPGPSGRVDRRWLAIAPA